MSKDPTTVVSAGPASPTWSREANTVVAIGVEPLSAMVMPTPAPSDPGGHGALVGQVWGDFELLEMLGQGGMGAVYRARQRSLDRSVAIKVIPERLARSPHLLSRFQREARAVAQIDSPHVVRVHCSGTYQEHHFFVMEFVEGRDLAHRLLEGFRPTHAQTLDLILQAARGLAAAGARGIVHRDIKPGNMVVTDAGLLKLADFGLVRLDEDDSSLTTSGMILGTVSYLSPEQGLGGKVDQRSDLYSLGVVFYQLLTGRLPFTGGNHTTVIYHHVQTAPVPPRKVDPDIPADYQKVVMRLLNKMPEQRYQEVSVLIADLERIVGGKPLVRRRRCSATGIASIAASVVVCLVVVSTLLLQWAWRDGPTHPEAAERQPAAPKTVRPAPSAPIVAQSEPRSIAPAPASPAPSAVRDPGPHAPAGFGPVGRDERGFHADLAVAGQVQHFRWCPPGSFDMGSPPGERGRSSDEDLHPVVLTHGFWLADGECPQSLWNALMPREAWKDSSSELPVHKVSRDECDAFLAALNKAVPGLGARLPWEAEWEYACRAGSDLPFASRDHLEGACFNAEHTRPVRGGPANAWGFHDMLGNVSEWCRDAHQPYPLMPLKDPFPVIGEFGVIRGGCWEDLPDRCRSAYRAEGWPHKSAPSAGMRIAVEAVE